MLFKKNVGKLVPELFVRCKLLIMYFQKMNRALSKAVVMNSDCY